MRHLLLIATSCLVLAACDNNGHVTPITRNGPGNRTLTPAGKSGEMVKPGNGTDGKPINGCLNLLNVGSTLTKASESEYTVFTSNMDLGDLVVTPGADPASCLKFSAEVDTASKAAVFLQKGSNIGPSIAAEYPGNILSSPEVGAILSISGQQECSSVQFKNSENPAQPILADVVCKDAKSIVVKTGDKGTYTQYALNDANELVLTYYTPVTVPTNCENTNPRTSYVAKISYTVSLTAGSQFTIDSKFGELINRYVAIAPQELKTAIGPRDPDGGQGSAKTGTNNTITLGYRTLDNVFRQFELGQNQLKCSKP